MDCEVQQARKLFAAHRTSSLHPNRRQSRPAETFVVIVRRSAGTAGCWKPRGPCLERSLPGHWRAISQRPSCLAHHVSRAAPEALRAASGCTGERAASSPAVGRQFRVQYAALRCGLPTRSSAGAHRAQPPSVCNIRALTPVQCLVCHQATRVTSHITPRRAGMPRPVRSSHDVR